MAQLIQMRQRLKAVETIKKITHAMQLISMSANIRLRDKRESVDLYYKTMFSLFTQVASQVPSWRHPLFHPLPTTTPRTLIIVVGSQKGLCGTFNNNLFYTFERDLPRRKSVPSDLICVGKKVSEYLLSSHITLPSSFSVIASHNTFTLSSIDHIIADITTTIFHAASPYTDVIMYSNYPVGFFVQRQQISTLIPLPLGQSPAPEPFLWEEEPATLLEHLGRTYLNASLRSLLMQSLIAEHAARFISMDSATRNASTLLDTMRLQYNKLRQTKITRELTELSTSFQ